MIIGVFIINMDGDALIMKPLMSSAHEWNPGIFYKNAIKSHDIHVISPCLKIDELYYMSMRQDEVFLVAVLETPNIASYLMVESMHTFIKECTDLIGELTCRNVIDHVAVVYELIIKIFGLCQPDTISMNSVNECKQFGPNATSNKLFPYLPDNLFGVAKSKESLYLKEGSASKAPLASRKESTHELFLDLTEYLTTIIDSNGKAVHTDLKGHISSKSYLPSPAQLQLALSENVATTTKREAGKILIKSKRFYNTLQQDEDQNKSFPLIKHLSNPGHSDILDYVADADQLALPFTMYHNFTKSQKGPMTELILNCKIFCALPTGISPINWSGTLPLPSKLYSLRAVSSLQSMTFSEDEQHKFLTLRAPIYPSQSHHSVSIKLLLSEVQPHMRYQMPFLNIEFEVPDLCISNMNIHSLKVQNVATNTAQNVSKWVRRSTRCKDYQFQLKDWME